MFRSENPEEDFRNVLEKRLSVDDLVYHGSLVAFHKNQLDHRADNMPLNDTAFVMDMVIFRTIFFELLVFFTFTLLTLYFAC